MSGQVSNPAISISQPLIREFLFTAQPLITKPLNFIFRLLSSFQSDGKEGRLSLRQLHCSVVRCFNVHPKKQGANVLLWWWIWLLNPHVIAVIDNLINRESFVNCQRDQWLLTARSLAFRMLQNCLGCWLTKIQFHQIKDALLRFPPSHFWWPHHPYPCWTVGQPRVKSLVRRLEFPPEQ